MNDLRQRFKRLDRLQAPDLWFEVTQRAALEEPTRGWRLPMLSRFAPLALAATAIVMIVAIGAALVVSRPGDVGTESDGPAPSVSPSQPAQAPTTAPSATAVARGTWTSVNRMTEKREHHTATLLRDGTVLVAGGSTTGTAEVYDPEAESWTPTGSLVDARGGHTATLLSDGTVLVSGGYRAGLDNNSEMLASAEIYDPSSGTWHLTDPMLGGRGRGHTATLLADGTVLVTGGLSGGEAVLGTAELYDPATGVWTPTEAMAHARYYHSATRLADGSVLVAGSVSSNSSAELYDPNTGTWQETGAMVFGRHDFTATLLADGRVLAAGSEDVVTAELYDPRTRTWTKTGSMLDRRLGTWTATLLGDGTVLVVGGVRNGPGRSELYDPATGTWARAADPHEYRQNHTATLLRDGTVLVAGGRGPRASAEVYEPEQ